MCTAGDGGGGGWWGGGVWLAEPLTPLSFFRKRHAGHLAPRRPNKGANYFNYGVIAESGVN